MSNRKQGLLIVISGPSGCGKGTVLKKVLKACEDDGEQFAYSVSATTRSPRTEDAEGVTYYFVSEEKFLELAESDGMIEYASFCGNYYGTPKEPVEKNLSQGKNVILEIEVQGALQVMEKYPDCVSIFILPPSMAELERRLRGRQNEEEEVILKRISKAKEEIPYADKYRFMVVNDNIQEAADKITQILKTERYRNIYNKTLISEVLNNEN